MLAYERLCPGGRSSLAGALSRHDRMSVERQMRTVRGGGQTVRMSDQRSWTVEHFSQANPVGEGRGDVPALLRRVADSIDALGEVEVQDLVLHIEVAESGGRPSLTVYFHRSTALRLVP